MKNACTHGMDISAVPAVSTSDVIGERFQLWVSEEPQGPIARSRVRCFVSLTLDSDRLNIRTYIMIAASICIDMDSFGTTMRGCSDGYGRRICASTGGG